MSFKMINVRDLIRILLRFLWAALDGLVLLFTQQARQSRNQVLIVRLDAIGDFVLWLDAARQLINYYHDHGFSVVLLGNKAWSSWAKELNMADDVWALDSHRFIYDLSYRWKWLRKIKKEAFSVAIQPTYSRTFLDGDALIRASSSSERIGSVGDLSFYSPCLKFYSDSLYTRLVPATQMPIMEIRRNAEFLRNFQKNDFKSKVPFIPPVVDLCPDALPNEPYAVLFPWASGDVRAWPLDNFIDIGLRLLSRGFWVIITGGFSDQQKADPIVSALSKKVINLVGKTSLGEFAEVLRKSSVLISNETSAAHIGVAVGIPVVCIAGGGHYGRFVPYDVEQINDGQLLPIIISQEMPCFGCNWNCNFPRKNGGPMKCIEDISVERVWEAVEKRL
jgi:ADP-heptose:LPS heptosyltransferase